MTREEAIDRLCEAIKESNVADEILRMLNWKL